MVIACARLKTTGASKAINSTGGNTVYFSTFHSPFDKGTAHLRNQHQQGKRISKKSGSEQKRTAEGDDQALHHFGGGNLTSSHTLLSTGQRAETFSAHKVETGRGGSKNNGKRGQNTDHAAYLDQNHQLC